MSYMWKFQLDSRGMTEKPVENYSDSETKKKNYVETYLKPSVSHANCGWKFCSYVVMTCEYGEEEYVMLAADENIKGGRYICVSGNSLGAIAKAVWQNVFN